MPTEALPTVDQLWNVSVWNSLLTRALLFLPQLATGIVLFVVFWIVGLVAQRLVVRVCTTARVDSDLAALLGRIARIALVLVGLVTSLGTLGVDVTALVTGLGLTGFALGFALKDIISNTLAGILVLIYEPFKRNDRILVSGLEGVVKEINLRYTVLEMEEKRTFIPNSNLFTNPVVVLLRTPPKPEKPPAGRIDWPAAKPAGVANGQADWPSEDRTD